jgi:hypothetical protein
MSRQRSERASEPGFFALIHINTLQNMAHITTEINLQPYGKVRISGEVKQDLWADRETEGAAYSPFDVRGLTVIDDDGEVLQGSYEKDGKKYQACGLDQCEVEICEDALIDKYIDHDSAKSDYLIDEAKERNREREQRSEYA